jgi:hypothetical protein
LRGIIHPCALDWDAAQEFKQRLRIAGGGVGNAPADAIERHGTQTSVLLTDEQKRLAYES